MQKRQSITEQNSESPDSWIHLLAQRESFKLQPDSAEIIFMNALRMPELIRVEEYLQGEAVAKLRHEFVAGQIFAMAGASERHNRICFAFAEILGPHLRKDGCRGYLNDMKLRTANAIYYPDVMVVCDLSDQDQLVKSAPCMIIEVLSESTERTDRTEKLFAYQQISTLRNYLLVAQDKRSVELYRRNGLTWRFEHYVGDAEIQLDCPAGLISLTQIYADIDFRA